MKSFFNKEEKTQTELFVEEGLRQFLMGNEGDATYHPLYKAWKSFCESPTNLTKIVDNKNFGQGMLIFLSFNTISDIDIKQQISSIAYFFLSKAIKENPKNVALYKNRIFLMQNYDEGFNYTVSSVVNKDKDTMDFFFMNSGPMITRDSLYKKIYSDMVKLSNISANSNFEDDKKEWDRKIDSNFFGSNKSRSIVSEEGEKMHSDVYSYLEKKIIRDNDIEF